MSLKFLFYYSVLTPWHWKHKARDVAGFMVPAAQFCGHTDYGLDSLLAINEMNEEIICGRNFNFQVGTHESKFVWLPI